MEESGEFGGQMLRDKTRIPEWGTDPTARRTVSFPTCWSLGRVIAVPPIPGTQAPTPRATHPMPLIALIYRLSCNFTEQFMGIPVTCGKKHRQGPGLAGAPSPAPEGGHRDPPLAPTPPRQTHASQSPLSSTTYSQV